MKRGFTLIEVIIYIALFSLLMGSAFVMAFQLIQGSGSLSANNVLEQEGSFMLRKINWVLTGATNITSPSPGNSSNTLTLTKDGSPIILKLDGVNLELGGAKLNSSNVSVLAPTASPGQIFTHTGTGSNPESITAKFTLETKDTNGQNHSQDFETTKYLRK